MSSQPNPWPTCRTQTCDSTNLHSAFLHSPATPTQWIAPSPSQRMPVVKRTPRSHTSKRPKLPTTQLLAMLCILGLAAMTYMLMINAATTDDTSEPESKGERRLTTAFAPATKAELQLQVRFGNSTIALLSLIGEVQASRDGTHARSSLERDVQPNPVCDLSSVLEYPPCMHCPLPS